MLSLSAALSPALCVLRSLTCCLAQRLRLGLGQLRAFIDTNGLCRCLCLYVCVCESDSVFVRCQSNHALQTKLLVRHLFQYVTDSANVKKEEAVNYSACLTACLPG